jgi:hypothetical protein
MTTKEKYELFDKTKINEKVLGILKNMQESSKNFTDESVNSKIDSALDKLIENFRANKPEALLTLPEAKKEVKKEKEKAIKKNEGKDLSDKKDTDDKTGLPKKDTLEERKEIIKEEDETDKEARDRARKELEKEKDKAKDEVESQIEKLNRLILEDPALQGFNTGSAATGGGRSTPIIDAERKALPRGSRVSQKGWKNQYGASDGGRKYWENRENRSDRKSPDYETGKPYLAKGGETEDFFANGGSIKDIKIGSKIGFLRPNTGRYEYAEVLSMDDEKIDLVVRHPKRSQFDNYFTETKERIRQFIKQPSEDWKDGRMLVKIKYAKGGEVEGVDLFEDYDDQPEEVQAILANYDMEDNDYETMQNLKAELESVGYTMDFGLDAEPYDLRKIGQTGKSEFYAKGGETDGKYTEYEMVVLSKDADGKSHKYRFLISARNIDEAKQTATDGWHSEFGDMGETFYKVMTDSKYRMEYMTGDGGGVPYKPYGKTKGRFKLTYEIEGEPQSEIRQSLEEAKDSAKRYSSPKLGYTNVHIHDESGKEFFFADGGETDGKLVQEIKMFDKNSYPKLETKGDKVRAIFEHFKKKGYSTDEINSALGNMKYADGGEVDFIERMAKMRSAYENLNMIVKSKIAMAVGIDRAISIMENDYSIDPFGLITSAVRGGLLELDEINKDLVNEAVYEAENVTDDYRDSGQGISGSDMTAFTKNVLDGAGYKTGFINNRLERVDEEGNKLEIDKYNMNY